MKKNYGLALRKFRIAKGLSQNQLAKQAGITSSCVNQLEANLRTYSLTSLIALSKALEITPNDLLDFKDKLVDEPKIELYKVYKSSSGLGYNQHNLVMPMKLVKDEYVCIILETYNNSNNLELDVSNYYAFELEATNINPKTLSIYKNNTLFTYFYDNLGDKTNE